MIRCMIDMQVPPCGYREIKPAMLALVGITRIPQETPERPNAGQGEDRP